MQLINGIDTLGNAFNKENNNTKESFVNLSFNNSILTITKFNGTTIDVAIPLSTGNQILSPVGSITLGSSSGFYNQLVISPIDYLYNSQKYSIPTYTTLYLASNASSFDRLDAVYINTTTNTIGILTGTPASTPILPTLSSNQILVGAVYAKAGASPTMFNTYSIVYSAFQSQNINNQINQGTPIKYLNDLLDVLASTAGNGQVLTWDSSISKWIPTNKDTPPVYDSTAGNGLTILEDGTIVLGGNLFQNTEINLNGNDFILTNGTTSLIDFGNYYLIFDDNIKIDWQNGRLYDQNGVISLLFNNRQLLSTNSQLTMDWEARRLYGQNATDSLDWYQRTLIDYNQNVSLDWENRTLSNTSGVAIADFKTSNLKVYNTPVEGNDVANKAYVDANTNVDLSSIVVDSFYLQSSSGAYFQIEDTAYFETGQLYFQSNSSLGIDSSSTAIFTNSFGLYINPADAQTVVINETDFIVKAPNSVKYEDDYSANFTDRSLVDKAYVDNAIINSTSGLILSGTNGVYIKTNGLVGLGGNYEHFSDLIRNPFDYTYTQSASTLNDYQYQLNFKNYSSSGSQTFNTNYNYYNDSLYFTLKNGAIVYGMGNSGITFDSTNNQIYLQNNNLFFNTQNSGGTEKVRVQANPFSGFYTNIKNGNDESYFNDNSNYFSYTASNSSTSDSINFGAYQYQLYYQGQQGTQQYRLYANNSFQYYYNDSSNNATATITADTSSFGYRNTDYETEISIGSNNMLIKTGDTKHIENRVLFDSNEVEAIDWENRTLDSSQGQVIDWNKGYVKQNYTTITSDYTVLPTDYFIEVNQDGFSPPLDIFITLPSASTCNGQEIFIKHNEVVFASVIQTSFSELIDGDTSITLNGNYSSIKLISNGTKWLISSI